MDRDDTVELGVVIGAVALFVLVLAAVGIKYGTQAGAAVTNTGGIALVGSVVFFVLAMSVIGFWIAERSN